MAWCEICGALYSDNVNYCAKCGYVLAKGNENELTFWIDNFGCKRVVLCPRCRSGRCKIHTTTYVTPTYTTVIPAEVKTRYTVNLNPFRPFTLINQKTKVKRPEQYVVHGGEERTVQKYVCQACGMIF